MKEAGIREVRQNLSALLDDVRQGREVLITDRGRPVARLVPPRPEVGRPIPDLAEFRRAMPVLRETASSAIVQDRDDRL